MRHYVIDGASGPDPSCVCDQCQGLRGLAKKGEMGNVGGSVTVSLPTPLVVLGTVGAVGWYFWKNRKK